MHNGMIQIEGKKMSKSLGNFATIRELTATFEPEVIRFFILQSHYRQEVVFSHEALKQAHTTLDVLYFSLLLFYEEYETDFKTLQKIAGEVEITEFLEKLADDLNSPLAIAKLLEWSKELNKSIKDKNKAENLVKKILQASRILGLANHHPQDWKFSTIQKQTITPAEIIAAEISVAEIQKQIEARNKARQEKNWQAADNIRKDLQSKRIKLKDSGEKTHWYRSS